MTPWSAFGKYRRRTSTNRLSSLRAYETALLGIEKSHVNDRRVWIVIFLRLLRFVGWRV